jgi:hypothetical protein
MVRHLVRLAPMVHLGRLTRRMQALTKPLLSAFELSSNCELVPQASALQPREPFFSA